MTFYVDPAVGSDSNTGTAPGAGNAWATLVHALATIGGGDTIYAKASAVFRESGSLAFPAAISAESFPRLIGYSSAPGDGGQITVQAQSPLTFFSFAHQFGVIRNVVFDFNGQNAADGFCSLNTNSNFLLADCAAINITAGNIGFRLNRDTAERCVASTTIANASTIGFLGNDHGELIDCVADGPMGDGFHLAGNTEACTRCLARNCQTGFFSADLAELENCVAYNCSVAGVQTTAGPLPFINSIFAKCAYGVKVNGGALADSAEDYCAYYLSGTADVLNFTKGAHDVTLTADPFVSPTATINTFADAAAAFALNSTAGGGAACRAAGYPANVDLGATQHAEVTAPPATPSLSVTVSGQQVTFTVSGSTGGSSNTIKSAAVGTDGHTTWSTEGSSTGDGSVVVSSHATGRFLAFVASTLSLNAPASDPFVFTVTSDAAETVRQAVYAWLSAQSGLTALVGSDIFPIKAPQGVARPYVLYRRITAGQAYQLGGSAKRARALFELRCCADSYATADAVRNAVAAAVDAVADTVVGNVTFFVATIPDDGEDDDFAEPIDGGDTGVFEIRLLVAFTFVEAAANP